MKKLLFIILCSLSITCIAQEYPIYSPVRVYGSITLDPYINLPTGSLLKICTYHDTLWVYKAGWHPLYPGIANGFGDNGDTITFSSGAQVRMATSGIEIFPYNTGGRAILFRDINNKSTITASQIEFNINDTTYGAGGRIVYKSNGKYYGYNGSLSHWQQLGGTISGNVTISNNQIAYGTGANTVGGNANFLYYPGTGMQIETQPGQTGLYINNATATSENFLLRNTQHSNAIRITDGYTNSLIFNSDSVFYARIADGSDYIGISSDMQNNSSKNYIALQSYDATNGKTASLAVQTENTYSDVTIDATWFRAHADSIRFDHIVRFYGATYFKQWGTLPDTMALVAYPNGKVDTITIVFGAAKGWDEWLVPFPIHYWKSKKIKTLPQFKEINARDVYVRIEYEIERLNRYLWHFWIGGFLIVCVLVYQQFQIRKLRKR